MTLARLESINDLMLLQEGDTVLAKDRFALFTGPPIGNTPQKGINWLLNDSGEPKLIICRTREASGYGDRWLSKTDRLYLYHLMITARHTKNAKINHNATENNLLLTQQMHGAPILLLIDRPGSNGVLDVEGKFRVVCRVHDDPIHPKIDSVLLQPW